MRIGPKDSTLDDKGRITIPKPIREQFSGPLIITWGLEHCAWVMTSSFFNEKFVKRLESGDLTQEERLSLEDKLINMAEDAEMDSQGRIAIPSMLRRYAGLSKACIIIPAENRFAIWDVDQYFGYRDIDDDTVKAGYNKLGPKNLFSSDEG